MEYEYEDLTEELQENEADGCAQQTPDQLAQDDLFGGEEPDAEDQTAEDEAEEQDPEEEAGEQDGEGQAVDEPKYKVKFYGKEMELPVSELIVHAQKGMDYDNLRQRYEAAAPVAQAVAQQAQQNGLSVQQYMTLLQQQAGGQAIERAVAQGVPEQAARELYELRQREAQRQAQLQAQQAQQQRLAPYVALLKEHPGLRELPREVVQRIGQGMDPVAAYAAWETAQLRAQLAAQQTARRNRDSVPGSARGIGRDAADDPFLAGLNSD